MFEFAPVLFFFVNFLIGIVIPVIIILYAGHKQRPHMLVVYFTIIAVTVAWITVSTLKYLEDGGTYTHDPQALTIPLWMELAIGFVVMIIPIAILFYIARFIGKKRNVSPTPPHFAITDVKILIAALAATIAVPLIALGYGKPTPPVSPTSYLDTESPITPETFFYFSGLISPASPADIETAEARLGISLPQTLKDVYARANGGDMAMLFLPTATASNQTLSNWRPIMGGQLPNLLSLTEILPVFDIANTHNWDKTALPDNATNWIVISQNDTHFMFLDYTGNMAPRLGLMKINDKTAILKFNDIDAFFAIARVTE